MILLLTVLSNSEPTNVVLHNAVTGELIKTMSLKAKKVPLKEVLLAMGTSFSGNKLYLHHLYCKTWALSYLSLLGCEVISYKNNSQLPSPANNLQAVLMGLSKLSPEKFEDAVKTLNDATSTLIKK
uniref:Uncharacterized protein n=1 Tax=Microbotryum lychnidis-dioicae TaxID=288795 RepID=M1GMT9_9BASI|nr:hypothetical protein H911_mgp23 [Microbotryum lychnidis-dioicae]YP_007475387.1 hypothetical protein H911_mgp17 [Microbotryum lychnidis-dioicae]AGE14595.1 hypothetical protein [Microbotryum lychnidis-dioicae]AGE14601.1 hypothetical protein [Microbotryum lychnidis-dioicae]